MTIEDLYYRDTNFKMKLVNFADRLSEVTGFYEQFQLWEKRAMPMGVSLDDFNMRDKLLDLQIECKQILIIIDDIKKHLEDMQIILENYIKEQKEKWKE